MNKIFITVCVLAIANAIRVPTKWPDGRMQQKKYLTPINHAKYHHRIPTHLTKYDLRQHKSKFKRNGPLGRKLAYRKTPFTPSPVPGNVWFPIAPYSIKTNLGYMQPKPNVTFNLRQYPKDFYTRASSEYVTSRSSPLYKNYRDDKTYEREDDRDEIISENPPKIQEAPEDFTSDHEVPLDIPTAPIYPGEGEWAKPGRKHKPFVVKHKFTDLKESSEENPDGYEIFEQGKKLFDKKRSQYENSPARLPKEEIYSQNTRKPEDDEETSEEHEEATGFIPMTLYAQVRRSENEEHLPSNSEDSHDGRLKEVIRDSKIQTVYTEEGYEDSAYDHAGHEKEAEEAQGYKEYNEEEQKNKKPHKRLKTKYAKDQEDNESRKVFQTTNVPEKPKKYPMKNKNKFSKTKATKTMKLKEKLDGTQMEITSGVKVMMNPDSSNKTEEIIEILPETVKYTESSTPNVETEFNLAKLGNLTASNFTESPTNEAVETHGRKKRFTNDFPEINVEKDFTKDIVKNIIPEYKKQGEGNKYPYYDKKFIHEDSPMKYAENLANIPKKTEGRMAIYDNANGVECPEVDEDIESIAKQVKNIEQTVNDGEKIEESEEDKSPRLGKLGQRIDCFKRKYFGDNPLDSPFFKEKTIAPVPPLFKIFEEKSAGFQSHNSNLKPISKRSGATGDSRFKKYHSKFSIQNIKNNIREDPAIATNEKIRNLLTNSENEEIESKSVMPEEVGSRNVVSDVEVINVDDFRSINHITTEAVPALLTTPDYAANITPKHIYDQIELLEFLPDHTTEVSRVTKKYERQGKIIKEATINSPIPEKLQLKQSKILYYPKRRQQIHRKIPRQTFDMNSYLLYQSGRKKNNVQDSYQPDTKVPQNDQIMPFEQLNVFADVLNNIKNGTNDPLRASSSSYQKPIRINSYHNTIKMKIPSKKVHIRTSEPSKYLNDRNLFYLTSTTTSTTTDHPERGIVRYSTTEKDFYDDEYSDIDEQQIFGQKKISGKKSTTVLPVEEDDQDLNDDSESSGSHVEETSNIPVVEETTEILGLVPPSKWKYRTIFQPVQEISSEPEVSESEAINTYFVVGMKPPSTKQKVFNYKDFQKLAGSKGFSRFQKINHRRGKRSPNRRSYFEVIRGQTPEIVAEKPNDDDDDYVPHRPKNWHWDENLKKIIYDKPRKEEEEDEEVIEVEEERVTPKIVQESTTRRSFKPTTPNGPSYVDFVNILKKNENYVFIPDPTTTKMGITTESSTPPTTKKLEPTKPPEFLSVISKIRQNESYKLIEDKKLKVTTTTTTTEAPEESEEVEDTETALSNIQNSPGRGAVQIGHNLTIFDVNDFLPKLKSYTPRTSIDYSKYKTIQRTTARQQTTVTPEELTEDITTRPLADEGTEITKPSTQGKLEIFELNTTPSSTEAASSTTAKLQRVRGRRPISTTLKYSATTNSKEDVVIVTATKPKRVYPRRRPSHIRTRNTTEKQNEDATESQKVVVRRHNSESERQPKIISLETIIMLDNNRTKADNETQKEPQSSPSNIQSKEISVDDILKNINQLKEINIEEIVPDYTYEEKNTADDLVLEEPIEERQDYYVDDIGVGLDHGTATTNKKLVISKDKGGMYYYTSV
ncbi:hypothetical protein HHI36_015996 [Cryptolaemus montrouzieri]|uniref:Uncharacterized protein n=1 Tax=Cryptolaemus montrouzieri TaxID=559131 RepID=A0ABD2N7F3_9CUCU